MITIDMAYDGSRIACATARNASLKYPRVHIFVKEGSNWVFEQEVVVVTNPQVNVCLNVAIDGNTVVMPCMTPGNRHFVLTHNGSMWEVSQEINTTPAPLSLRLADVFDSRIVLGAASLNNGISDAVYVFDNFGGFWDLTETLEPSDMGPDVSINSVAIHGNTIVAGCPQHLNTAAGKAYIWD